MMAGDAVGSAELSQPQARITSIIVRRTSSRMARDSSSSPVRAIADTSTVMALGVADESLALAGSLASRG